MTTEQNPDLKASQLKNDTADLYDVVDDRYAEFSEFRVETRARIDHLDDRLDRMDGRFDRLDDRFGRIDSRLDRIDNRLDRIDGKLDRVNCGLAEVLRRLPEVS